MGQQINAVLLVAAGGALGAAARYGTVLLVGRYWQRAFPLSTLAVNLAGCFAVGVLAAALLRGAAGEGARLFAVIGFLGAYTTFSTFSLEAYTLLQAGRGGLALLYAGGSMGLGLLCTWAGLILGGR